MSLLHEIQSAVLNEGLDLGPILLKLRLLASRIGSQPLADWVKFESEGYINNATVPDYRILPVSYTASFSGPYGTGIQNAPISSYLIEKFAGKQWVKYEMNQSIAAVDELLSSSTNGGSLGINAANLILLLQGKVYPDYSCISVTGNIPRSGLAAIRHSVRSRVLELTIELEKMIPEASVVSLGPADFIASSSTAAATKISQQIIYGNYTSISAVGNGNRIDIAIVERNTQSLKDFLSKSGLTESDASELAKLASDEEPESKSEPMGPKVREWIVKNIKKATNGTWKVGISIATDLIKEALLKYYGL